MALAEDREAYVKSLQEYQENFQSNLATLLERLKWSPQHFLDQESSKVNCSFCPHHKMPAESLKKHEEVCQCIQRGYTVEELRKEAPSSAFFYEKSKISTIKLEKDTINSILNEHRKQMSGLEMKNLPFSDRDVPQTLAASQVFFSQSERLAVYEFIVRKAKESQRMQSMPEDILLTVDFEALIKKSAKSKEMGEPCSEAEKWAAMRDYKRRRQSYRAKNVHITKKTYTEIIREVIHNQVDLLQEVIKNEENDQDNRNNVSKHDSSSDAERRVKRNPESKTQSGSSLKRRDRESPDRRKREMSKSDPRARDQKSPDKWRRDHDSPNPRKRDRKSPESRSYRSKDSSDHRRSRSSPHSKKRDHKSPDMRKREKDNLDRRRSKKGEPEESKKRDRENPEGVSSRNKSPDHKKRKQEGECAADGKMAPWEVHESKVPLVANDNVGMERFRNTNESLALRRLTSGDDSDGSSSSHRHRQKHKKSKKHRKHKHKSDKHDK